MYMLGRGSLAKLDNAHPDIQVVVKKAIKITDVDFSVFETLRTIERQRVLVARGASKTMNSKHLPNKDGLSEAVDLVPWVDFDGDGDSELVWHWPLCYKVADAVRQAAIDTQITIVWGGVWDRHLNDLSDDLEEEVASYILRRKSIGKSAFVDGPHFQILYQ